MKYFFHTFLFLVSFAMIACEAAHKADGGCEDKESEHGDEIHFTAQQAEAAGLQLETVAAADFRNVLKVGGRILATQGGEQTVVATADGIVAFPSDALIEGAPVSAGQTIVTLSARKLQDGDPAEKAKIAYEAAEKEYLRARRLVDEQIVSAKEFEQIALRYETAKVAYRAQAAQMTKGGVSVTAPIGGFLKKRLVSPGDYVTVGTPIVTVTRNRRLHLRAEVPQSHYKELAAVNGALFQPAYDSQTYRLDRLNGRLLAYGKTTDESGGYLPVTFEFDNVGDFLPGAYADVFLLTHVRQNVISLPLSALTEQQGLYYVYVASPDEEEAYLRREVKKGQENGERVEIVEGLSEGDRVVVRGAYQVKLAAASSVVPEGHSH